jgi:hypothetical protein
MATVTVTLDRDLEARVKKYAEGVGVPLENVLERALVFALKSRYDAVDPGYGRPGGGPRPDQGLPDAPPPAGSKPVGPGGRPDNTLPGGGASTKPVRPAGGRCPIFNPEVDNELPDEEVPTDEEIDNSLPETPEPK